MSWASYEDYCAEISVITPEPILCIGCETNEPEPGCDHCDGCLEQLNERAWERSLENFYGGSGPVTAAERHQHDFYIKRGLK